MNTNHNFLVFVFVFKTRIICVIRTSDQVKFRHNNSIICLFVCLSVTPTPRQNGMSTPLLSPAKTSSSPGYSSYLTAIISGL